MFYHVALIRFQPEATEQQIDLAVSKLCELPNTIKEITTYTMKKDAGIIEGGYDAIIIAEFANLEAYRIYQNHPHHGAVAKEFLVPILGELARLQYET